MSSNLPKIIGITGRKFNGKDSLGNYLCKKYDYKRLAYADALKEACRVIFNFSDAQLYGDLKEVVDPFWKVTPRTVLQFVGTDLFRDNMGKIIPELGHDIWVKVVEKQILDLQQKNPNQGIVITDVRFPNEVESVKRLGGLLVRVKRPSVNNSVDVHASEIGIEKLDVHFELLNDGTLEDLYSKFHQLNV